MCEVRYRQQGSSTGCVNWTVNELPGLNAPLSACYTIRRAANYSHSMRFVSLILLLNAAAAAAAVTVTVAEP